MSIACIVLAAGDSTRMRSAHPKVLHALCHRPVLTYVADVVTALRCQPVVAVVGAHAKRVRAHVPSRWKTVHQRVRRGTGQAVALAMRQIPRSVQTVLVVYGDQPLLQVETIRQLCTQHRQTRAACTVLATRMPDPTGYGRVVTYGQLVVKIVEEADATDDERENTLGNVGVTVFDRAALARALREMQPNNAKDEYYLTDAITWLARAGTLGDVCVNTEAEPTEALGINSRADMAQAAHIMWQRTRDAHMAAGVTLLDPSTTYIDPGVRIGQDTVIHPCTMIEGNSVIGRACHIGPYARIRTGVRLSDHVTVGNFTEIVRSRIGAGVRMHHHSYLGDAIVGAGVNIGAGTITANYDGKHKHTTQIHAKAFIGSGTVIVAPASIGAGATTGAGSVVTAGTRVAAHSTVVGVPASQVPTRKRRK
jgi:bifunctional UDP-N-acetylglucosamine pyrophosphorylase / glucosamine-1-phosphate N-acetyltransferase